MNAVQDIPKLYTAWAEWLSCAVFVSLLKRRWGFSLTGVMMAASLAVLCALQYWIGIAPISLWIPGMVVALAFMYAIMVLGCKAPVMDIGFYWAIAFIVAEFAASLEWQFYSFYAQVFENSFFVRCIFLIAFYGMVFGALYMLEKKHLAGAKTLHASGKETVSAGAIAIGAFLISNISYVNHNTPLSGQIGAEVFYIRTLVDLAGVVMLIALQNRLLDIQTRKELDSIQLLLQRQYEQYRLSKESIEVINRKYHDLKHQIGVIRMESSAEKRDEYLSQLESEMRGIGLMQKTGNDILDTILFNKQLNCARHRIELTAVAEGERLGFMNAMDICSIFGNALDNAIESVLKLDDAQKRLIRMAVYTQNNFLMIRIENYFENPLEREGDGFQTTKKDKAYHGYGIKSIQYTAEKYGGTVSVEARENWFYLRVLLPVNG